MDISALRRNLKILLLTILLPSELFARLWAEPYYGRLIGKLSNYAHGITGKAYAVDESTIFIKNFSYDGTGPGIQVCLSCKPTDELGSTAAVREAVREGWPRNRAQDLGTGIQLIIPFRQRRTNGIQVCLSCKPTDELGSTAAVREAVREGWPRNRAQDLGTGIQLIIPFRQRRTNDAYFWVGNTPRPSPEGYIVPYPEDYKGRDPPVLHSFKNQDVILKLPIGKKIRDIRWLSVWCRRFTVNFGDVFIPPSLEAPRPRVLPEFKRLAHGLRSGNITVLDAKTFYIPNLHYDGAGPDAYFWVGNGTEPSPLGIKVPNEMGSLEPLRGYQGEDIEIQLPGNLTVHDIDWLAVWCVQYRHNFGHVLIPKDLDIPPALGQTKITPPWWYNPTSSTTPDPKEEKSSNCRQLLNDKMQVQWDMKGEWVQINLAARMEDYQYMAFGLSGEQGRPSMVGGDVVVAFHDTDKGTFRAEDYYMSATAQCDGKNGVCPDERIGGRNDVKVLWGERRDGVTTVVFKRLLQTNEPINDRGIPSEGEVSVIAAIGPLNSRKEANAHAASDKTIDDIRIDFSSRNDHACTASLFDIPEESPIKPWPPAKITQESIFSVRIGPTGGKRGYSVITKHPSWGIAWYINDMLIPEITVERGQTYTFIVEGGNDRTNPARYHPFYITDNSEGGFGQKSEAEQKKQRVFAGVGYDAEGYPYPTAAGRYCEWAHKTIDKSAETETFDEYLGTLRLTCDDGEAAILNWTVAPETPDLVYYQCYTHNNLGWKIHVVDMGYRSHRNGNGSNSYFSPSSVFIFLVLFIITFAS